MGPGWLIRRFWSPQWAIDHARPIARQAAGHGDPSFVQKPSFVTTNGQITSDSLVKVDFVLLPFVTLPDGWCGVCHVRWKSREVTLSTEAAHVHLPRDAEDTLPGVELQRVTALCPTPRVLARRGCALGSVSSSTYLKNDARPSHSCSPVTVSETKTGALQGEDGEDKRPPG